MVIIPTPKIEKEWKESKLIKQRKKIQWAPEPRKISQFTAFRTLMKLSGTLDIC